MFISELHTAAPSFGKELVLYAPYITKRSISFINIYDLAEVRKCKLGVSNFILVKFQLRIKVPDLCN